MPFNLSSQRSSANLKPKLDHSVEPDKEMPTAKNSKGTARKHLKRLYKITYAWVKSITAARINDLQQSFSCVFPRFQRFPRLKEKMAFEFGETIRIQFQPRRR